MTIRWIALDTETTGLDPLRDDILSIAMVAEDGTTPLVSDLPTLDLKIQSPNGYRGSYEALKMNRTLIEELMSSIGISRPVIDKHISCIVPDFLVAIDTIDQWLDLLQVKDKFTATGKNVASFDLQFLKRAYKPLASRIHHRVLDVGTLLFDPNKDSMLPNLPECVNRVNAIAPELIVHQPHVALLDAMVVIKILRHYYKLPSAA